MSVTRTKRLRLIIYIRVSLEREKMYSPKTQLKGCLRYADKYDHEVVGEPVTDLDKTGRDFAARKIAELILRVYNGEADGILIYRINRWGRNAEACMDYLKQLDAKGGVLVSTKEVIDLTTSAGRKAIRDAFSDAEYESDVISDNWKAAHDDRFEAGLRHSGREVFGYRRCIDCRRRRDNERAYESCDTCEGVLIRDDRTTEKEAPHFDAYTKVSRADALIEFVQRHVAGEPTRSIVTDMAARGVRSLFGNPLDAQAWFRAADTGFWAGWVRRKSEKKREVTKNSHAPEDYDIWEEGNHLPLLHPDRHIKTVEDTEALWLKYKRVRANRGKRKYNSVAQKLASGYLRCWEIRPTGKVCKASMTSFQMSAGKGAYVPAYRCSAFATLGSAVCRGVSVEAKFVEEEYLAWLEENEKGSESMDERIRAAAERTAVKVAEADDLRKKVLRQKVKKATLIENYTDPDNDMSEEDYKSTLRRFNDSISKLEGALEAAEAATKVGGPPPASKFASIRKEWPRLSVVKQRQMLGSVVGRFEVRRRSAEDKAGRGHGHNLVAVVPVWDAA